MLEVRQVNSLEIVCVALKFVCLCVDASEYKAYGHPTASKYFVTFHDTDENIAAIARHKRQAPSKPTV